MTMDLATFVKSARLTALRDAIDSGSGTARLTIYTGPRPEPGGPATTALVIVDLPIPSGEVSGDTLTLALPDMIAASADGDIAWARITNRAGDWVLDMDAGDDPAAELYVSPATVTAGGLVEFIDKRFFE